MRQPARRARERVASADNPSSAPAWANVSHRPVGRAVGHAVDRAVGLSVGRSVKLDSTCVTAPYRTCIASGKLKCGVRRVNPGPTGPQISPATHQPAGTVGSVAVSSPLITGPMRRRSTTQRCKPGSQRPPALRQFPRIADRHRASALGELDWTDACRGERTGDPGRERRAGATVRFARRLRPAAMAWERPVAYQASVVIAAIDPPCEVHVVAFSRTAALGSSASSAWFQPVRSVSMRDKA